jgi:hypothetical protein
MHYRRSTKSGQTTAPEKPQAPAADAAAQRSHTRSASHAREGSYSKDRDKDKEKDEKDKEKESTSPRGAKEGLRHGRENSSSSKLRKTDTKDKVPSSSSGVQLPSVMPPMLDDVADEFSRNPDPSDRRTAAASRRRRCRI